MEDKVDDNRKEMLNSVIKSVEKQYGKGSIMLLGNEDITDIPVIPSGSTSLDIAMGIGGYPRGRIIEIFGPESSGKTTLALHAIAEAQKKGGAAAFIDVEHAFDINYAKRLGIQVDSLVVSQPDYAEQALEIAETLVRSNAIDILIIDSVAALVPKSEIEGEMGESQMGVQARLMSQALRKLTAAVSKIENLPHLHQPAPQQDRRLLRQPGDDDRRQRAQILRFDPYRYPQGRKHQGQGGCHRKPGPREDPEKQTLPALPRGYIRHHLRQGYRPPHRYGECCRG